jgi:hypothetical protein
MKQNRTRFCIGCVCIAIIATGTFVGFTTARAQGNGALNRLDRGQGLPTLKLSGAEELLSQTFLFECTEDTPLEVQSVTLVDAESNFEVEASCDCGGFPMTIVPGDLVGIRIKCRTKDLSVHYNQLRFNVGVGVAPILYNVEAQRVMTSAGVHSSTNSETLSLFTVAPNPSQGMLSIVIDGQQSADVDIFDALGNTIASRKGISTWKWDGVTNSGTPAPSGSYIIRSTTGIKKGKRASTSKNIVISR